MNDTGFYNQWAAGLDYIIDKLGWQSCHLIPQIHVMDASDGSLLSLLFAKKYQLQLGLTQDELNSKLSVKSLERKIFSNIFFSQLTEANELAETISFFNSIEELNDEIDINDAESPRAPFINVLFSECYYFQLNSQPTWQSVSYLYIVNALCPLLREDAIIVPARARIMCAAVQLYDLYNSHGLVDK